MGITIIHRHAKLFIITNNNDWQLFFCNRYWKVIYIYILLFALFLALIGRGKKSLDTRTINTVELFIKDGL